MAKGQISWPRAVCLNCGQIYERKQWRHGEESGATRCGVRTCMGYLWMVPNKSIGWALARMERDVRARWAQLQMLGERCE